jgi:hypothetical protein
MTYYIMPNWKEKIDKWDVSLEFADGLTALNWTTEPPTAEGWYWVYKKGGAPTIKEYRGVVVDVYFPDTYWLGPIPIPDPPKD